MNFMIHDYLKPLNSNISTHHGKKWLILAIAVWSFMFIIPFPALAKKPLHGQASLIQIENPHQDPVILYTKSCKYRKQCYYPKPLILSHISADLTISGNYLPITITPKIRDTGYIKGVYLGYYGLQYQEIRTHVQNLLATTELNAIIIDVKSDNGLVPYTTSIKTVFDVGAYRGDIVGHWSDFSKWFKERNIYMIARIVVFKDERLAVAHPEWAVIDAYTGYIWRDQTGQSWIDPTEEAAWDYSIDLAVEAAQRGFDEIQFDYIRFPTDGFITRTVFSVSSTPENRMSAITGFIKKAHAALQPYDIKIAADVFGYTIWQQSDSGIGQRLEMMAPYLDVLSPMLYPSTFEHGLPNMPQYQEAINFPYEILYYSMRRVVKQMKAVNPKLEIRPWIQQFPDYNFDKRSFSADEIRLQMNGARDGEGYGWMVWDMDMQYQPYESFVSASPSYPVNLTGNVLVLRYPLFNSRQYTSDNFWHDLSRLRADGFYPVNLADLASKDLSMVPAGKKPIVLTFDVNSMGSVMPSAHGTLTLDSVIDMLKSFHAEHPANWPMRATFLMWHNNSLPDWLVENKFDNAHETTEMIRQLGMEVRSYPTKRTNQTVSPKFQKLWQTTVGSFDPNKLRLEYAFSDINQLTLSPYSPEFDPHNLCRVPAIEMESWLSHENYYVSAGEGLGLKSTNERE
ncbi:MAG: hypothetical protein B6242_01105 [Anaerolineaceae bacterium 4572_78]|nr:MAG: hypothetical protein B6242_01105 [Anaerolineaceae bacterium 4572_78]